LMTVGLPVMRNHLQLPVLPPHHITFLPANSCSFYTGLGIWWCCLIKHLAATVHFPRGRI
jgi:hypothetical protein